MTVDLRGKKAVVTGGIDRTAALDAVMASLGGIPLGGPPSSTKSPLWSHFLV